MAADVLAVGWRHAVVAGGDIPGNLARLIELWPTLDAKVLNG
jgi:hypothetical protein